PARITQRPMHPRRNAWIGLAIARVPLPDGAVVNIPGAAICVTYSHAIPPRSRGSCNPSAYPLLPRQEYEGLGSMKSTSLFLRVVAWVFAWVFVMVIIPCGMYAHTRTVGGAPHCPGAGYRQSERIAEAARRGMEW